MIKKIDFGKTDLKDLYQVFGFGSIEEFERKKSRLFPNGNNDNEIGTTSIILSAISAVKEFREELFTNIGITKIKSRNACLHAYTELNNSDKSDRPDALVVITSGKHNPVIEWACFIESKVGDNLLDEAQINRYIDFASMVGIKSIITISNHLVPNPSQSPLKIKKRNFELFHWSWAYLKVTSTRLIRTDSVDDADHVYILKELRRYLENHKKIRNFINMGKHWKTAVSEIHSYSIDRKISQELLDNIVHSYSQEERDISLQLTDRTTSYVELLVKSDRKLELEKMLQQNKIITSCFFINNDKKNIFKVDIDFIRQMVKCYAVFEVSTGKAQAQTSAIIRRFEDAAITQDIKIVAYYPRKKCVNEQTSLAELIEQKNKGIPYSIVNKDFGDEIKTFEVKTEYSLGKNFASVKNFIAQLENATYTFATQIIGT